MDGWCIAGITSCDQEIGSSGHRENKPTTETRRHGENQDRGGAPPLPPFLRVSKVLGFCFLDDPMAR